MFEARRPEQGPDHSPGQLSLLGMDDQDKRPFELDVLPGRPHADQFLMFFAFLPPDEVAAAALAQHAEPLRARHNLEKPAMAQQRLHLTVQPVVSFAFPIPKLIVSAAVDAAKGVAPACRAVPICFDRVGSMGVRPPSVLALQGDAATAKAVAALRNPLLGTLRRHGFVLTAHNAPHMSLVYDTDLVPVQPIEPLRWTATRLVLVLSHHGRGHHQHVAEWPLRVT